jgi:hypothetical protein
MKYIIHIYGWDILNGINAGAGMYMVYTNAGKIKFTADITAAMKFNSVAEASTWMDDHISLMRNSYDLYGSLLTHRYPEDNAESRMCYDIGSMVVVDKDDHLSYGGAISDAFVYDPAWNMRDELKRCDA